MAVRTTLRPRILDSSVVSGSAGAGSSSLASDSGAIQRLPDQPPSCSAITAPMSLIMDSALGKTCTTRERRLVSRFVRS